MHRDPSPSVTREPLARLADAISSGFGHCEIVVNNAGISPRAALKEIALAEWRRTMAVNVESVKI
jgi:NAD(P)-dependent dehydrogenase (short-subunit alcohol dehydrogenase family)